MKEQYGRSRDRSGEVRVRCRIKVLLAEARPLLAKFATGSLVLPGASSPPVSVRTLGVSGANESITMAVWPSGTTESEAGRGATTANPLRPR